MGPIGFPKTSVRNYHYSLRNSPEERGSHLVRAAGLKSEKLFFFPGADKVKCHVMHNRKRTLFIKG